MAKTVDEINTIIDSSVELSYDVIEYLLGELDPIVDPVDKKRIVHNMLDRYPTKFANDFDIKLDLYRKVGLSTYDPDAILNEEEKLSELLDKLEKEDFNSFFDQDFVKKNTSTAPDKLKNLTRMVALAKVKKGIIPSYKQEAMRLEADVRIAADKASGPPVIEHNGKYFVQDKSFKEFASFKIENIRRAFLQGTQEVAIVDIITDEGDHAKDLMLSGKQLTSISEFREACRTASFTAVVNQEVTAPEFNHFTNYFKRQPYKSVDMVDKLGYHYQDGIPYMIYMTQEPNGSKRTHTYAPFGKKLKREVYYSNISIAEFSYRFAECDSEEWKNITKMILENVPYMHDETKMIKMLAWLLATPLRYLVDKFGTDFRFPHYHVVGVPGSGKTTILDTMSKIMGYNGAGISWKQKFSLEVSLFTSNMFHVWVDEYKLVSSKDYAFNADTYEDNLRRAYDSGFLKKGKHDLSYNVWPLTAPVLTSGESNVQDAAMVERTIIEVLSKEELGAYKNNRHYKTLKEEKELNKFALSYHKWFVDNYEQWEKWLDEARSFAQKIKDDEMSERDYKKSIAVVFGMQIIQRLIKLSGANYILNEEKMTSIVRSMNEVHKSKSSSTSLEFGFLKFLAARFQTGIHRDPKLGHSTVNLHNKDIGEIIFHSDHWKSEFSQWCVRSEYGPQQKEIIQRTIDEIERKEVIKKYKNKTFKGKTTSGFGVDINAAQGVYGIELFEWDIEEGDPLTLD